MEDLRKLAEKFKTCSDDERLDLLASIQRREMHLRVLNSFAVSLIQITNSDDLAWYVAKEVVAKLGFVDCVFYEFDAVREKLVQRAAIGEKNPEGRTIRNPIEIVPGEGVTGTVAQTGKALLIPDVRKFEGYVADIGAPGSELCVPLTYGNEILGVIDCENPEVGHFKDDHLEILQAIASLASSKLAECRALKQMQGQAQILRRVREAVVVTDVSGLITDVNEGATKLFGHSRDLLVGRRVSTLMADDNNWRWDRMSILGGIRDSGEWRGYLDMLAGDGEVMTVDASLTTLADQKGRVAGIISVARDVTDLLKAERAILEKNEALESKQVELEKALVEGEAARRANRAKDVFLANTSHELRTPLAGVIGMINLLADTGLSDEQVQLVETANVSAHSLLTIIDDILDLAKMEVGTLSLREAAFDPVDLVVKTAATLKPAASAKGLQLNVSVADDAPRSVVGDASRIRQILFNLVGNAVKFTEEGHIDIVLDFDRDENGLHFMMEVRDTGIGFSNSEREKIFARFEQLDASSTKSIGGTGLGLSISRELAQMMGGTLRASGREGEGATFYLHLPVREGHAEAAQTPLKAISAEEYEPEFGPLKVLIAEDNAINQMLIEKILERYGWELKLVSNGREAVDLVEQGSFDLVLMDIRMPVMDGVTATRAIRASSGPQAGTPIIALTANTMEDDKQVYMEAGMDGVVGKPVDRATLLTAIGQALEIRRRVS
ncbi:ATP-binding protein [Kordiimonas gwangyangensis]|uniref:ATP-binding protein n=2 Tax=Kordiimonas gwangyangensis TaxID=288022 RepID=UPI0003626282|nr:ATP-binding protein [Kordiimonas gwangyangensis]